MVLSLANVLRKRNINYQKDLLVEAIDISEICVYMTYIQLSLYGIPAVVYCGDTLTLEMRLKMETPLYYLQQWKFRKFYMQNQEENSEESNQKQEKIIIEKPIINKNLLKEVTIKGNNQISLW